MSKCYTIEHVTKQLHLFQRSHPTRGGTTTYTH